MVSNTSYIESNQTEIEKLTSENNSLKNQIAIMKNQVFDKTAVGGQTTLGGNGANHDNALVMDFDPMQYSSLQIRMTYPSTAYIQGVDAVAYLIVAARLSKSNGKFKVISVGYVRNHSTSSNSYLDILYNSPSSNNTLSYNPTNNFPGKYHLVIDDRKLGVPGSSHWFCFMGNYIINAI